METQASEISRELSLGVMMSGQTEMSGNAVRNFPAGLEDSRCGMIVYHRISIAMQQRLGGMAGSR